MIYPDNFVFKTGVDRIREQVKTFCLFEPGRKHINSLKLLLNPDDIKICLDQVEEFRQITIEGLDFPADHFIDLSASLDKARIDGTFLEEEEISSLRLFLESFRNILNFFKKDENNRFPALKLLTRDVRYYPAILERINVILNKHGKIKDNASKELESIRREIAGKQTAINRKLNSILRRAQSEGWVEEETSLAIRNGRPVIPVPANHKRRIHGYIHDESGTGKTAYIEPAEILESNNELRELEIAERKEIIRILTEFTRFLRDYLDELNEAQDLIAVLDSCRARALFALSINAVLPRLTAQPGILWRNAYHPVLLLAFRAAGKEEDVVPLDIELNEKNRILVISGPNAGGKSVCLQTIGLLQYMLQCGFLVPVSEDSKFGIFHNFFIDIGDEQSIDNDLSTYSSHLQNMKFLIKNADNRTLALIDEFGSGTEPMIGGAIAEAVLERINELGCYGVVTTHYTNLKHFAASAEGIINGAMLFDTQKIRPLFKLATGRPGSSFAFEIARKIGLPEDILNIAKERAGQDNVDFDKHLRDILRDKKYWEHKRQKIRLSGKQLAELVEKYDAELNETERLRKTILMEARQKADEMLLKANKQIEKTIREIREAGAEKEKTRIARQKLKEFNQEILKIENIKQDELKRKITELKKHEQILEKKRVIPKKPFVKIPIKEDKSLKPGDFVVMKGQETPGEIIGISGKKYTVAFGDMQTRVKPEQIEKISRDRFRELSGPRKTRIDLGDWNIGFRKLNFSADIDLRGKRADDALRLLTEFIDEAVMVQANDLRILHGKGNGILRELVRQQLKANNIVKWFGDEHPDRGGSGITIVKLDI